jgi:hypothetical protein
MATLRERLSTLRARALADGSFEVTGQRYRLYEPIPGHLDVSNAAGTKIGRLGLPSDLGAERLHVERCKDRQSRRVLRAIARLLAAPRGFLPIQ